MKKIYLLMVTAFVLSTIVCENVSANSSKTISSINASQLYPMWFPGNLLNIKVTGTTDHRTYNNENISYGLDYVVMKYEYPRFNYVDSMTLKSDCYLVQFVDNFTGLSATMSFDNKSDSTLAVPTDEQPYVLVGNLSNWTAKPSGKFLKYNTSSYRFLATSGESVASHEAYIITNATNPVNQIVPGITNGIKRVYSTDGTKLSIKPGLNSVCIYAAKSTIINIYSLIGQGVKVFELQEGYNSISLPKGLYITGNTKFVVK